MPTRNIIPVFLLAVLAGCAAPSTAEPTGLPTGTATRRTPAGTPLPAATPTASPTPAPTATTAPGITLEKDDSWLVDSRRLVGQGKDEWEFRWNDNVGSVLIGDYGWGEGTIFIDALTHYIVEMDIKEDEFELFPSIADHVLYFSPNKEFVIDILWEDGLALYQVSSKQIIGRWEVNIANTESGKWVLSWAKDESAIAAVDNDGKVWVWEVQEGTQRIVGQVAMNWAMPTWSPDMNRLAVTDLQENNSGNMHYQIMFRDGREPIIVDGETSPRLESGPLKWISSKYFLQTEYCGLGCSGYSVFEVANGKLILSDQYYYAPLENFPLISPDMHWIVLDEIIFSTPQGENVEEDYSLYDLKNQTFTTFGSHKEYSFDFLDWSLDSQYLELIRVPGNLSEWGVDGSESGARFGLLRFYPQTRSFSFTLRDAIYVIPKGAHMFGVTLIDPTDLNGGMAVAIFTRSGERVTDLYKVSNKLLMYSQSREPDAWAWSIDGQQVVYADQWGDVWLLGVDGNRQQLAAGLVIDDWPYYPTFTWSPDDRCILAEFNDQAWILQIDELK
ncbi:MAG: hypothetical protein OEY93_10040 [Anaerolineae bacterium]|nr:hypothetical protein [Anaerolineae bacterium]